MWQLAIKYTFEISIKFKRPKWIERIKEEKKWWEGKI